MIHPVYIKYDQNEPQRILNILVIVSMFPRAYNL